jgi:F0F1-type ATP synthase membrane subunit b/b'
VWESSCTVRDSLVAQARREAEIARALQEEAAVSLAVRTHTAKSAADSAIERVARRLRRLVAQETGGLARGALRKALSSRDRPLFNEALDFAIARGWLIEVEQGDHYQICLNTDEG